RGLDRFTKPAVPAGQLQDELQSNLRDTGTYESLLKLMYVGTASTSRFDSVSHLDPSHLLATPCATYKDTHDDQCDYHWVKQQGTVTRSHKRKATKHRRPSVRREQQAPAQDRSPLPTTTPKPPSVKVP